MKAWLKGGLVALIIFIIIFLILAPFKFKICGNTGGEEHCTAHSYNNLILIPSWRLIEKVFNDEIYWLIFLSSSIIYFLAGTFVGLIIEKIKKKNPKTSQKK